MTTPQLNGIDHLTMNRIARITGGLYVAYILASVLADVLGKIGLGTAFIRDALAYELDARVELDYRVDGVYWQIVVPLTEDS